MNRSRAETTLHSQTGAALAWLAAAMLFAVNTFGADDLPAFKPGMWNYSMNIETPGSMQPHTQSVRRCSDPTAEIRKKWQALAVETCKFSPIKRDGNRYSYTSSCQKNGMELSLRAVITMESDAAYRVDTESKTNSQVRRESLVAKREGDCVKSNGHPPVPQPRTDPPPKD